MPLLGRSVPMRATLLKVAEALLVLATLALAFAMCAEGGLKAISKIGVQAGLVGLVLLLCLYFVDFFEPRITTHRAQSVSRIMQSMGITMIIAALILPALWPTLHNTKPVLIGMLMAGACLTTSRCLFAEIARRPAFAEPAIVWGSGVLAASIIHELQSRADIGIRVLGIVDTSFSGETFAGVRYLGPPELMWTRERSEGVRRIVVALDERRGSVSVENLLALKTAGLSIDDGAELYEELTGRVWLGTFSVTRMLFSRRLQPSLAKLLIKRVLSVLCSLIAITLTLPLLLLAVLLIRIDSAGPVILRQIRVGQNGRHFILFKFRTMRVEANGSAPATHDDPRCTRVGKWLRRLRIDELPQLFNILKGDMYFVGPRPFLSEQEEFLVREIPCYRQRWNVRPGATGWAQVHRDYCSSLEDNIEKLSYDLFYIKNLSGALDLLTLLKTLKVLLLGRGGR